MPGGPQSCPLGDFPSSLGATSLLLLSLPEPLALSMSVGHFIRTRLLTSPWDSSPIASLPSPLSSQHTLPLVGPLRHCYMRPRAEHPLSVSIVIKKEEFAIVVPLLVSEDKETKSRERSPLSHLHYPNSSPSPSRASSRLTLYCTRSPPTASHLTGEAICLTQPAIQHLS